MLIFVTVARAGDRDPGYPGTTTDKYRQVTNISQAARHATPAADLERGIYATPQYKDLRRSWQDVSYASEKSPVGNSQPESSILGSRDR
jgi:hypothetical protein